MCQATRPHESNTRRNTLGHNAGSDDGVAKDQTLNSRLGSARRRHRLATSQLAAGEEARPGCQIHSEGLLAAGFSATRRDRQTL
jgi:hypothetical protein